MGRKVQACPECDETKIYHRRSEPREHPYKCQKCGTEFDDPVRRKAHPSGGRRGDSLASKLANNNPDELGI